MWIGFVESLAPTVDRGVVRGANSARRAPFWRAVLGYITQVVCGIRGHELLLHYAPRRLSLRCTLCGYQTRGWEIGTRKALRPVQRIDQEEALSQPLHRAA